MGKKNKKPLSIWDLKESFKSSIDVELSETLGFYPKSNKKIQNEVSQTEREERKKAQKRRLGLL